MYSNHCFSWSSKLWERNLYVTGRGFPFIYLSTSDAKLKDNNLYYTSSLRAILALVLIIHKNGEYGVA